MVLAEIANTDENLTKKEIDYISKLGYLIENKYECDALNVIDLLPRVLLNMVDSKEKDIQIFIGLCYE